jgi:hypothetical protein
VGDVPLDKSINGHEFRSPAIHIDDFGVPLIIITDYIRTDRSGEVDNGMSPLRKLTSYQ